MTEQKSSTWRADVAALVGGGLWVARRLRPRPMEVVPAGREG